MIFTLMAVRIPVDVINQKEANKKTALAPLAGFWFRCRRLPPPTGPRALRVADRQLAVQWDDEIQWAECHSTKVTLAQSAPILDILGNKYLSVR